MGANLGSGLQIGIVQTISDLVGYLRFGLPVGEVEDVAHRPAQIQPALRQPDGMDMGSNQVFVGQVHSGCLYLTGDHLLLMAEKVLVVWAANRTVGENQGRLSATSGSTGTLRVVGGSRGHVPHIYHVQLGDIDPQLHGRRAEEHRQTGLTKLLLAFDALLIGHLGGVFPGFDAG